MSEVKMPVAAEEVAEIVDMPYGGCSKKQLAKRIADIQRRTLLAAADECRTYEYDGTPEQVAGWLERIAASLGEQGK